MRIVRLAIVIVFFGSAALLFSGCAKDPQVNVTPFVLKPCVAQPSQGVAAEGLQAGTRPYEEAVQGTAASARR